LRLKAFEHRYVQHWNPPESFPGCYRLAMTGGVCGGKSTGKRAIKSYLQDKLQAKIIVLEVPEVATKLFELGALNYGTHKPLIPAESFEVFVQLELLQLAYEDLWARAGEIAMKRDSKAKQVILLCDRDALDSKGWTSPVDPEVEATWPAILEETGRRLHQPKLCEESLVSRYQLGAVFMQSLAVLNGRLNTKFYDEICIGPKGNNDARKTTAKDAAFNDERMARIYQEVYPPDKLCFIVNNGLNYAEKLHEATTCAMQHILAMSSTTSPQQLIVANII